MKTEYGIPVPRGVPKDWVARDERVAATLLFAYTVPPEWDDPLDSAVWRDRFGRIRLIVGHYPNGRSATVRIDANGNWKTSFGDVDNG